MWNLLYYRWIEQSDESIDTKGISISGSKMPCTYWGYFECRRVLSDLGIPETYRVLMMVRRLSLRIKFRAWKKWQMFSHQFEETKLPRQLSLLEQKDFAQESLRKLRRACDRQMISRTRAKIWDDILQRVFYKAMQRLQRSAIRVWQLEGRRQFKLKARVFDAMNQYRDIVRQHSHQLYYIMRHVHNQQIQQIYFLSFVAQIKENITTRRLLRIHLKFHTQRRFFAWKDHCSKQKRFAMDLMSLYFKTLHREVRRRKLAATALKRRHLIRWKQRWSALVKKRLAIVREYAKTFTSNCFIAAVQRVKCHIEAEVKPTPRIQSSGTPMSSPNKLVIEAPVVTPFEEKHPNVAQVHDSSVLLQRIHHFHQLYDQWKISRLIQ